MYEAILRIESTAPFAAVTEGTDAYLELYCSDHSDLLVVRGADPDAMLERVRDRVPVRDSLRGPEELVVITERCLQPIDEPAIERYLDETDSLLLSPIRYENGLKIGRVLALDPANLTQLYVDLAADYDVTVEAKRELTSLGGSVPFVSLVDALPTLTARQREVLLAAHRNGYFEIPRGVTLEAIGDDLGIGRRTTEEHLRRAVNKLMDAFVEYL
ncbi:helix-turn-helix domain-containing protein [Halolamina rubra]|uniref:helix-turn-helix domain-containing protein n=1 Tax=Halolamina rubra TaxID=1380430 RepID=UPI00067906FB|nr:helix-turn-helix domain-containing protein [Halolamina rubra]